MAELIEALFALYAKFYSAWLAADVIFTSIGLIILLFTQSTETFSQLITNATLGAFPPPFLFLVIWKVDPFGFLFQFVISIIILIIIESRN